MKKLVRICLAVAILGSSVVGVQAQKQKHDKGEFVDYKNEFMDRIVRELGEFNAKSKKDKKKLTYKLDFRGMNIPKSTDEFTKVWFNPPISQGVTSTCWDFSTTSYFESEIQRLGGKKMKISEAYTVYWEYVEKARRFVAERGASYFAEGSEANAVTRIWKKYGCVPEEVFPGMKPGQPFPDHSKMFDEMSGYLRSVKANCNWNEEAVLSTIKSILNTYFGVPPTEFTYNGEKYTPVEFQKSETKLNMDDYVEILSLMEEPYWTQCVYPVEDNWWMSDEYYNIPLDTFMDALKSAVKKGYSVSIGGDVSEPGYDSRSQCAIVPTFDIPSEYIDDNARQLRFTNRTTTDDHGVHLVGYKEIDGKFWFLIKDSGSGSRNGANKGFYFWHEDYVKLKMMNFTIHRSAVEDILSKFKK